MRMCVAMLFGLLVLGGAAHADPLDRPFAATPAELLSAARAAPASAKSVALRREVTDRYDDDGRVWRDARYVGVVTAQEGIDAWATEEVTWTPSFQDRPTFRARVIAPDGSVTEVDPSQITDTVPDGAGTDTHVLHVDLPHVTVGSVVEEEYTIADREPLLDAGALVRIRVAQVMPVERTIITIEAPAKSPLRVGARGFAKAPSPRTRTADGRTTWTYDLGPLGADWRDDESLPGDGVPWPYVEATTAPDWATVAASYRRVLDAHAVDVALPGGVRGATPRDTIDRALAWLHAHVQDNGIGYEDVAIAPEAPADVIAHGRGDKLARAALLAAVLRAAGVRADLALVWAPWKGGPDVDRALPGLEWFDWVIVRAQVDGADVWIDPAETDLPAGQLAASDQGRLALVIAGDTRDLVTLPIAPAADNLLHDERTYHLAELDDATITARSVWRGAFGATLRQWARGDGSTRKALADDVASSYDGRVASVSAEHADDVTQPVVLNVEIADAGLAHATRRELSVWLHSFDTLGSVPALFTDNGADVDAAVASRTADYVWPWPHVHEIVQRLEVPPGFAAPELVAHEERALGTMTLTTKRAMDGGTIVITYRLDTGPRRITAAQLAATRAAVQALGQEHAEHVVIPLVSLQLLDQGKLKEAIAECRRMIALHPKEALHWGELANAYRYAGMGAAARRAAREGTRVQPGSSDAWMMLGTELADDSTGRPFGWDSDRAGAIAAYRKALALVPTHLGALDGLATLLDADAQGGLTTSMADRREALALRKKAAALAPNEDDEQRAVVVALLETGAYAEADAAAQKLPDSEDAFAVQIAAAAVTRGATPALARLDAVPADAHVRVLGAAVRELLALREYDPMLPLYVKLAELDKEWKTYLMSAARLTRIDLAKLGPADPTRVAILAHLARVGQPPASPPWDADTAGVLAHESGKIGARNLLDWRSYSADGRIDEAAAASDPHVEGDARHGWHVATIGIDGPAAFYVALEHGRARLIGGTDLPGGLAAYALELLARKDTAGAARWVDQLVQDLRAANPRAHGAPERYLAVEGIGDPPAELVQRTAAIFASTRVPAVAAPILRRCPGATTEEDRVICRAALYPALVKLRRWNEMLDVAGDVASPLKVDSLAKIEALLHLKRSADAAPLLDDLLAKAPHDRELLAMRARIAELIGGPDDAKPFLDQIVAASDATARDLNIVAWLHLAFDASPDEALAIAKAASQRAGANASGALQNTLAAALAHADQPWEAWQALQQSIDAQPGRQPDATDWYVLGRIAEDYGLRDDAIADYQRATPDEATVYGDSGWDLAQRALARLKAAPSPHIIDVGGPPIRRLDRSSVITDASLMTSSPLRVAVIGGLTRATDQWKRAARAIGVQVEHHDGQSGGRRGGDIEAIVRRADVVLVITDLNSHNGVSHARRAALAHGRPHLLLRRLRPDGMAAAIAEAFATARAAA
jgi:tetratricopeptide (TPR) repeat protein